MMFPRLAACAGLIAALALAVPAAAQPKGGGTTEAVTLAREAKEKYDQGKWAEALALFQKAEDSAHSPVLLLYAARCHRNLGQLVRARELYGKVGAETLAPNAPEPFRAAQRDAKSDLDVLEPRIPRLVIDRSRAPASWTLDLDGAAVASTNEPILVDPGAHVLVAKDGATETFKRQIDAREGERVPIVVEPAAKQRTAHDTPTPRQNAINPDETVVTSPSAVSYVPGAVLLTLGVGGLAAGVATRVIAFQKVDDVKSRCSGNRCLASDREEIESADTLQTVSTIAFAAGGAVAATGIILLIVLPMQDQKPAVSIRLDPTGATLTGSF
jgi:hypothetical protein